MRGISFSEPMVRAWLAGAKSVTRRLMNPQPTELSPGTNHPLFQGSVIRPKYLPGETVYIKETWVPLETPHYQAPPALYKAEDPEGIVNGGWRSPRFMPEWASRSKARIVSVRPEKIQSITREDAIKEGLIHVPGQIEPNWWKNGIDEGTWLSPIRCYEALWESLHPGSFERNDCVWRIELEKLP